jgi:dTDP-4-amino-4,6-dideoxygalactose transaminase
VSSIPETRQGVRRPGERQEFLVYQLPRLDDWIDQRASICDFYDRVLDELPLIPPLAPVAGSRHARHLNQAQVAEEMPLGRDALLNFPLERRICTGVHYRGVHMHPYYRDRYAIDPSAFPLATEISNRTLSLPLSPKITREDREDVCAALAAACQDRT